MTDESFLKLENLNVRFDINAKYDIFVPVSRAKCVVYRWATNRRVSTEKHVYFCNDCNINICIDCHQLLKAEEDMLGLKEVLYKRFINEEDPKFKKKKIIVQLNIKLIEAVWSEFFIRAVHARFS